MVGRCEAWDIVPAEDDAEYVRCTNSGVSIRETDGLWRGPQPTVELWSELQDLGIKTSIKLNYDYEGGDCSDAAAANFGIAVKQFAMPPSTANDWLQKPDPDLVYKMLEAIDDSLGDGPVYVHCLHGHDRTGLACGLFRIRRGMTIGAAYAEMRAMGFHRLLHGLMESWESLSKVVARLSASTEHR